MKKTALLLALTATFSLPAFAQVYTDVVGFTTLAEPVATAGSAGTLYLSLNLRRPSAFQAKVSAVSTANSQSTLTFSPAAFTANQFNGDANSHYIEIINGDDAGVISQVTATGASSVTLADDLSEVVTANTTSVRIRPNWTFGTAFGPNNSAGFQGAGSSDSADIVYLGSTGYFYNTSASQWQSLAGTAANNIPIPADTGLQITRRGSAALTFKLVGEVKSGPAAFFVAGGNTETFNLLPNPYALDSVMLKDSGLYQNGDVTKGVKGGANLSQADVVRIQDPIRGGFDDFYFNTINNRWMSGFTDASLIRIPSGSSVAVIRRAGSSDFQWYASQPLMALGGATIPFSLVSAVSRKQHAGFGDGDVNLPLNGSIGVENRTAGSGNSYNLVFEFTTELQAGMASSSIGTATSLIDGNRLFVTISGASNAQIMNISLNGLTDVSGQAIGTTSVPIKILLGDVNASGQITGADVAIVKSMVGLPISLGSFKSDVNASGPSVAPVSGADVAITKSRVGTPAP